MILNELAFFRDPVYVLVDVLSRVFIELCPSSRKSNPEILYFIVNLNVKNLSPVSKAWYVAQNL